jgi:hypothetical protein
MSDTPCARETSRVKVAISWIRAGRILVKWGGDAKGNLRRWGSFKSVKPFNRCAPFKALQTNRFNVQGSMFKGV